jgi:hypothetical protein
LKRVLTTVADKFVDDPSSVQGMTRRPNTVAARLGSVLRSLSSSWDAPTPTQLMYLRQAESILGEALKAYNKAFSEDVAAYKEKVESSENSLPFPEIGAPRDPCLCHSGEGIPHPCYQLLAGGSSEDAMLQSMGRSNKRFEVF